MKQKAITLLSLSAILLSSILVSCLKEKWIGVEQYTLAQAKEYFESHASDLSIPISGTATKANILDSYNIIPQWQMAKQKSTDSSVIYEIPLISSNRLVGALLNVRDSVKSAKVANFAISLVIEKLNNINLPVSYVSSILISNKNVKPEYIGNRDKYNGFVVKSQLDGTVIDVKFYTDGLAQNANLHSIDINNIPKGYIFYGFAIHSVLGTKGGDSYESGEKFNWDGWIICSSCGYIYHTDNVLDNTCTFCGDGHHNGLLACDKCGRLYENCVCDLNDDDNKCGVCGRLANLCTCEKDGDKGEVCQYCNLVLSLCPGHQNDTCYVCNAPLLECPGHSDDK